MAGIYIHIPFCRSRCIYCGFYSTTSLEERQRYVDAVCRELTGDRSNESFLNDSGELVSSIYLGGGTPSQLTIAQLRQIFDTLNNKVAEDVEVTIEVNPDDVTDDFANGLHTLPVNRVSMGAQTFCDARLRFLHRRHTAGQVAEAIGKLRKAGIGNISVDLMYGFPNETMADWEQDIEAALKLNVEHLSAYCLMVEEGTLLQKLLSEQCPLSTINYILPDEELERQMYETLIDRLEAAGYEHYEISNFSKPGFHSRHNSSYWDGTAYIGIGAAAHSYDGRTRSWNVSDIHQYMEGMERGKRIFEEEVIDEDTRYNDMVTVSLRTKKGLDLSKLSEKHKSYCIKNARRFINDGLVKINGSYMVLTRRGLFVSDMIMSELMWV